MNRSVRPRVRIPFLHRPKLERLEPRLPPGDALLGVLITSSFASRPVSGDELTLTGADVTTFENVDGSDAEGVPPSALPGKSVRTAVTDQEVIGPNRKSALDAALPVSAPERSHGIGRLAVAQMGQAVAGQSAMIEAPGVQGLAASHPALARATLAGHVVAVGEPATPAPADEAPKSKALDDYGNLPLTFEANHGQTDSRVDFITRTGGATVFLTPTSAVFSVQQDSPCRSHDRSRDPQAFIVGHDSNRDDCPPATGVALHMQIVGANPDALPVGVDRQPGIVNYFIGNDPSQWHANIPTFGRVEYENVYPGIDLAYYGGQSRDGDGAGLEYDFIVSPGADPNAITLNFAGADGVEINPHGDLVLHTAAGDMVQQKPFTYQEVGGMRMEVASRYVVDGTSLRFEVGAYDRTQPLVIDPLVMGYSTFLGGALPPFDAADSGIGIAVDATGSAHITGLTRSTNFPTTPNGFDTSYNGDFYDAYVAKLDANGSTLLYATYLGGSLTDIGRQIGLDADGNSYVTGFTGSGDFPTTPGAFDLTANGNGDAFAAKLNATGSALTYATYLGGSQYDYGFAIALDSVGDAYVTGDTHSTNFPTTPGAFDTTQNGASAYDSFAVKLSPSGSELLYSTYFGGSEYDYGRSIVVDASSNAYLTGYTRSYNFPSTPGAFQESYNGGPDGDAYVAKLSAGGDVLIYATYLGGFLSDEGHSIAVDLVGNAYVTGETDSSDFPTTPGAFDTTNNSEDPFVVKLSANGTVVAYATFLGGSSSDYGTKLIVDSTGNAYVTGYTRSSDFPVTPGAFDTTYNDGGEDAFLVKLDPSASALAYATYLGGNGNDSGYGIAVDGTGNAYVSGSTLSTNFPTTPGAFKRRNRGSSDAFVTKFAEV